MRKIHWLLILIIAAFGVLAAAFYPNMPERIATHWGFEDQPDGYMEKQAGIILLTTLNIGVVAALLAGNIVMTVVTRKNYHSKKPVLFFDFFAALMSLFLLVLYTAVLSWNAGMEFSMPKFVIVSAIILTVLQIALFFYIVKMQETDKTEINTEYIPNSNTYKDNLVEIGDGNIVFKNYYFPAGDKQVEFVRVEYIEEKPCTMKTGKWRLHGTGDLLFRVWFPADYERPSRDRVFFMKVKDKWTRIGFTVQNSVFVSGIFREMGLLKTERENVK